MFYVFFIQKIFFWNINSISEINESLFPLLLFLLVMFENLSNKLDRAFKVLKGQGRITEINVASTIKEIRRALIDADVSYKVAKEITSNIKDKAMGQNVLISCLLYTSPSPRD